ncbi:MAG: TraB/GumN family protein [Candidatus Cohnella colombiensis]|uniref:TraB/GumN family protein n=1 Tax=Candidatus Cohnella colombiensis TaxID=3121368 RepID=A0AA95EV65_9BACL|nr:MAG: TraB/GumN family protein [Cohnella sp.]
MKRNLKWSILIVLCMIIFVACSPDSNNLKQEVTSTQTTSTIEPSSSNEATTPSDQTQTDKKEDKPAGSKGYLWKVTGGKNAAYLVGTIHLAKKEMYPLDPDLEQALEEANYIALELDLTKVNQTEVSQLLADKAMYKDGTTLKDHVPAEDYEKFTAAMKKSFGMLGKMYEKFEPWYSAMTLESIGATKYSKVDGIDKYLAKQGHKAGKKVLELESMESQLAIFDGFSDELQLRYFHMTVEATGQAIDGTEQLLDMWTKGDESELMQYYDEYMTSSKAELDELFDEFNTAILDHRNKGMVEKIDGFLNNGNKGTYLIAVGSLHMPGEKGLVNQLRELGYTVEYID